MGHKKLLFFPAVAILSLASCSGIKHNINEYVLQLNYKPDYRILQLTDTHISDVDNTKVHYDFMDLTIRDANPDLIVITGDVFTFASRSTAQEFFKWLDGHGVNWTVVWGNHDEQTYFNIDWVTGLLNDYGSHCVFKDIQDDNVQGNSNFAINLMKDGNVFEQLILMDSNRYLFGSYFGYDYFHQNQIDWYSDLIDYTAGLNGGVAVPSLMFYHIPLPEVRDAWAAKDQDPNVRGEENETPCNPDYNSGFFKVIKEKGSTHGMYFGHDHVNDFVVKYEGIDFGYGIKATSNVYNKSAMLGGRVITLKEDHSLAYQDIFHQYTEVM